MCAEEQCVYLCLHFGQKFWSVLSFAPCFFASVQLLRSKGQSLRYSPGRGNPRRYVVTLYVEEGSKNEQCCLLSSWLAFSHFPLYPQVNCTLLMLIPGWVDLCTFWEPVGLSEELSCEAGSFSHHCTPHRVLQTEVLRLYFPALEPWVAWSVLLPSCSSWFICI